MIRVPLSRVGAIIQRFDRAEGLCVAWSRRRKSAVGLRNCDLAMVFCLGRMARIEKTVFISYRRTNARRAP
jgi:hypothetical protein